MAKFLNKKEQVFDLKLTSYGNHLLSQGTFKPVYYAFYDDNIVYDLQYSAGKDAAGNILMPPKELQNDIQRRIKDETSYIESFVLFDEIERHAPLQTNAEETHGVTELDVTFYGQSLALDALSAEEAATAQTTYAGMSNIEMTTGYSGIFASDYNPTQEEPRLDFFKYNAMIGDAYLDGDTQAAPAWKVITLQGQISSSATEDLKNRVKIPQVNIDLKYIKEINDYDFFEVADPDSIQQLASSTSKFKDGKVISLRLDDAVVYADEVNTELLTENFEIEVFEVGEYTGVQATGSLEFVSPTTPGEDDSVTINDGIAARDFTFVLDGDKVIPTEVEIGSNRLDSARNFFDAFVAVFTDFSGTMTAEIMANPNDSGYNSRIEFKNNQYGPYYNIPISTNNSTKFTIQGMDGGVDGTNILKRKFFERKVPQIKDGLMLTARPKQTDVATLTSASVEYYFDILTDYDINQTIACKGAETYNKESYYIDLDFDCDQDSQDFVYNDIYGRVTEPEICL